MQKNGKHRTKYQIVTGEEEAGHGKRRNFALAGGIICLVVLVVYTVIAAYPSKLFSEERNLSSNDSQPVDAHAVRSALPVSPLNNSTQRLFASTSTVMEKLFSKLGKKYTAPSLQLFEDTITAYECGQVLPAAGAFYCTDQHQVFIDLSFFEAVYKIDTLSASRAQAYMIAHQVGHHIEDLMGITAKLETARNEMSDADYKKLSLKSELLADYYAGVWAHYAFKKSIDYVDAEMAISDVTRVSNKLSKNSDITLPDAYNYIELGPRADNFYDGYVSGDLKAANVFAPGELK